MYLKRTLILATIGLIVSQIGLALERPQSQIGSNKVLLSQVSVKKTGNNKQSTKEKVFLAKTTTPATDQSKADKPKVPVLTLAQAAKEALATDLNLEKTKQELAVASSNLGISKRLVTINGEVNYSKTTTSAPMDSINSAESSISSEVVFDSGGKWSLSLSRDIVKKSNDYSFNLYPFNKQKTLTVLNHEIQYYNQLLNYKIARISLIVKVRNAYAEALQKKAFYDLALENLNLTKKHLQHTQFLFKAGKVARLSLLESEQEIKAAETDLVKAALDKDAAFLSLGLIMGRNQALENIKLEEDALSWATTKEIDIKATVDELLKSSPELRVAKLNLQLKKTQLRQEKYCHLANLELEASLSQPDNSIAAGYKSQMTYSMGISGSLDDLFLKKISNAKKETTATGLALKELVKNHQLNALDLFRKWRTAELLMVPMKDSVTISKEKLRIASIKYNNGMIAGSDVIKERQALNSREKAYWQSWLNLQKTREEFFRVCWGAPIKRAISM